MNKPILCLDFDGVLHSYTSGWKGADVILDPPVDGAAAFVCEALETFDVQVFSSRSNQDGGIFAMQCWLKEAIEDHLDCDPEIANQIAVFNVKWPKEKPPAKITIDDRAITFNGIWPDINMLHDFQPWNKH